MTNPNNLSPEEAKALTERLVYTHEPIEVPVQVGQDSGPDYVPRSVKLAATLDRQCKKRALSLGLSQSAYIRGLIERDLAESDTATSRPAWVRELLTVIAHHEHDQDHKAS